MVEDLVAAVFFTIVVVLVLAPGVFLFLGWRDLRSCRYEKADTRATLAGICSVGQFALAGFLASLTVLVGEAHPASMAIVAVPSAFWILSRVLRRSNLSHREADRRERRSARAPVSPP